MRQQTHATSKEQIINVNMPRKTAIRLGALAIVLAIPLFSTGVPSAMALQARCQGEPATIILPDGGGLVFGTPGRDVVVGTAGNDQFDGQGGDDLVCLGPGNDYANGQLGKDQIYGEDGNDTLYGSFDSDLLVGGRGKDTLWGDGSRDHCIGSKGKDKAPKNVILGGCERKKSIP